MSDKRALIALGAILTLTAILGISQVSMTETIPLAAAGIFSGHVTTTVLDSEGNIKAYRQTDNIVVNQGFDCGADLMFGTAYASCGGLIDDISINSQTVTVLSGDTSITGAISTETGTLATSTTAVAGSGTATLRYTHTFGISASDTVGSTGLLSGTTLFAGQTVGSPIPVVDGDSVTINWKITVT